MPTPVLAPDAPIFLVLNAKSGKGEAMNAREVIERGCTVAGRMLHTFPIDKRHSPRQQARAAVAAAQAAGGIVAVAGGDGTINATAQAVLGSGCAFGVLPQGTFNYFGRNHGIPTDVEGALEVLLTQQPQAVQVGQVNDRVFLVNASMGLYASLLEDREAYKSQYGRNRLVALAAALTTLVRGHRPWMLRLSWQDKVQELRTTSLFVGNNALQFEQVGVAEGEALTQGALAAVVMKPQGLLARVGLLLRGALRRLDDAKTIDTLSFRALDVEPARGSRRRRVKVATDGELAWMEMPLRFQVAPEPLWLIRPATPRVPETAARDTTA